MDLAKHSTAARGGLLIVVVKRDGKYIMEKKKHLKDD